MPDFGSCVAAGSSCPAFFLCHPVICCEGFFIIFSLFVYFTCINFPCGSFFLYGVHLFFADLIMSFVLCINYIEVDFFTNFYLSGNLSFGTLFLPNC